MGIKQPALKKDRKETTPIKIIQKIETVKVDTKIPPKKEIIEEERKVEWKPIEKDERHNPFE